MFISPRLKMTSALQPRIFSMSSDAPEWEVQNFHYARGCQIGPGTLSILNPVPLLAAPSTDVNSYRPLLPSFELDACIYKRKN